MSMSPLTNWDFMDYCFPILFPLNAQPAENAARCETETNAMQQVSNTYNAIQSNCFIAV